MPITKEFFALVLPILISVNIHSTAQTLLCVIFLCLLCLNNYYVAIKELNLHTITQIVDLVRDPSEKRDILNAINMRLFGMLIKEGYFIIPHVFILITCVVFSLTPDNILMWVPICIFVNNPQFFILSYFWIITFFYHLY